MRGKRTWDRDEACRHFWEGLNDGDDRSGNSNKEYTQLSFKFRCVYSNSILSMIMDIISPAGRFAKLFRCFSFHRRDARKRRWRPFWKSWTEKLDPPDNSAPLVPLDCQFLEFFAGSASPSGS